MPSRRFKKTAAVLATIAYSIVAVGGYALHGLAHFHGDCHGHGHSAQAVVDEPELSLETLVADSGCGCGNHLHEEQQTPAATPGGPSFSDSGSGHDHHNCTICAILAQVKVGHQLSSLATSSVELCQSHTVLEVFQDFLQPILSSDARGPPTLLV